MKNVLILGAGTAGTMMANKLVHALPAGWQVTVVDRDDAHVYQPGLLFLPFGLYQRNELIRDRAGLVDPDVAYVESDIAAIDPEHRTVDLKNGTRLRWDLLIVATGCQIRPDLTEGMTGPLWQRDVFDFYTLEGSDALRRRLAAFEGGRIVVDIVDMPIKCPVAPLEFAFLADAHFTERGIRDKVELVYVTPLDGAFTKPKASAAFGDLLERRGISQITEFNAASVDNDTHELVGYDGRRVGFDVLVAVPLHAGAKVISESGLADEMGFVPTDKHTLQSKAYDHVFVIGDATDLPASKAGSVAHFQGDVLTDNILRWVDGLEPLPEFDGHSNCFIETGHGKAMLIDFNYETEPLPGRFPLPGLGPFTLLEESHVNHWGKLAFRWMYWNLLVKGQEMPFDAKMAMTGKWS